MTIEPLTVAIAYLLIGAIFTIILAYIEPGDMKEEDRLNYTDIFTIIFTWPAIIFVLLFFDKKE